MKLNSIKSCLLCQLDTRSPFLLSKLNFVKGHWVWNLMRDFHPNVMVSDWQCRWSPCLKAAIGQCKRCSSAMIDLNKNTRISLMNSFCHFFPSFSLLFVEKISSTWKSLASLAPWGRFGQKKSSSWSLGVILGHNIIGNSNSNFTPLSCKCWKNNSVFKLILSKKNFITPVFKQILGLSLCWLHWNSLCWILFDWNWNANCT